MYLTHDHAIDATTPEGAWRELRDRAEITDALYRFGLGQDLRDRGLFASSFAEDAEVDFSPASRKWGVTTPLLTGREGIVDAILGLFEGRVDTHHVVDNPRIQVAADRTTARLTALVSAHHLLSADHSRQALLHNRYDVGLVRDGERWVLRTVRIDNVWFSGDPLAIFGG